MHNVSAEECRGIVEQAMEWVLRMPGATRSERQQCLEWLMESPLHVREMLIALQLHADISTLLNRDARPQRIPAAHLAGALLDLGPYT